MTRRDRDVFPACFPVAVGCPLLAAGLFWALTEHLSWSDVRSFFPLRVSRGGNVGLSGSAAYRPIGRPRFHSGDGARGTGACWRPPPGTPVQLQLKMSPESGEIGLGAPRWWWKEGRGLRDGKRRGPRIWVALEINGAGWSGTPRGPADDINSTLEQPLGGERFQ